MSHLADRVISVMFPIFLRYFWRNCKGGSQSCEQSYEPLVSLWVQTSPFTCEKRTEGGNTHGSVHLLCVDRTEATWRQSGQAWLHQQCPPGLLSLCPPVCTANATGAAGTGDSSQLRVTWFLPQGLGVEASGWEEGFTAPFPVCLPCTQRGLEEISVSKSCFLPLLGKHETPPLAAESGRCSTGWTAQPRHEAKAPSPRTLTVDLILYFSVLWFPFLDFSTWQSHLRQVPAASNNWGHLSCLMQCLSVKITSVYQLYSA